MSNYNNVSKQVDGNMLVTGTLKAANLYTENDWKTYTPTVISGGTFATSATIRARYRLVGSTLHINFYYSDSAGTAGVSSGDYVVSFPSGCTLLAAQASTNIGSAHATEAATPINFVGSCRASGTTSPGFTVLLGNEATTPTTWGNSAPSPLRLSTATGKTVGASIMVELAPTSTIITTLPK